MKNNKFNNYKNLYKDLYKDLRFLAKQLNKKSNYLYKEARHSGRNDNYQEALHYESCAGEAASCAGEIDAILDQYKAKYEE